MLKNHIVYAKATRQYLVENSCSIELPMIFQFPRDCCETASILLGMVILKTDSKADIKIVKSRRRDGNHGRHFWNEIDGKAFDITADQFGDQHPPLLGSNTTPLLDIFVVYERSNLVVEIATNGWASKLEEFDKVATKIIETT